jgi:hypothetical protein
MIGIGVFAFAILYIWLSRLLITKLPNLASTERNKKIARIVVWIIVLWYPVIDHAISYIVYKAYALQHAGPIIYHTVQNVERVHLTGLLRSGDVAIRWNKQAFPVSPEDRNSMAYDFVEYEEEGKIYEESCETGYNGRTILPESKAQFFISKRYVVESNYYRSLEYEIHNTDGKILATCQYVSWLGGGFHRLASIIELGHSGGTTFEITPSDYGRAKFIHTVLKPRIAK